MHLHLNAAASQGWASELTELAVEEMQLTLPGMGVESPSGRLSIVFISRWPLARRLESDDGSAGYEV